jgi:hypothetical protein
MLTDESYPAQISEKNKLHRLGPIFPRKLTTLLPSLCNKKSLLIFFIIISIFSIIRVYSSDSYSIELKEGKNYINLSLNEQLYVSQLVKSNPSISVVSYIRDNKTIGYVNLYNGIGEDFLIENGVEYEIISNKNIPLVFPQEISR